MKMIRLLVTFVGMFGLLAPFVSPTLGQEEICEDLQGLHAEHGDDLFEYLSDTGEDCLSEIQTESTPASTASNEVIWSESGRGSMAIPVTLVLSQGTYSLNLIEPSQEGDWGNIWLDEVVGAPESCFPWSSINGGERISFASHLSIYQDCRLFATLEADLPSDSNSSWEVSIIKVSDVLPTPPMAQDWKLQGRGMKFVPTEIRFDPGIYRISISDAALGGEDNYGGHMAFEIIRGNPNQCFPDYISIIPTQIRIRGKCQIQTTLVAYLHSDHADRPWEVSIAKLD